MSKTLRGKITYNNLSGKIENKKIKGSILEKPVLTNLTIEPLTRTQTFNHEGFYGYDVVNVDAVDPEKYQGNIITFVDYDGTVLYKIPTKELKELPPLPEHEGLICQGWNWELEDILAEEDSFHVGPLYITDDNSTRLYVTLDETQLDIYIRFGISKASTFEFDWGDGIIETVSFPAYDSITNTNHVYSEPGDYRISFKPLSEVNITLQGYNGGSGLLIGTNVATSYSSGGIMSVINKIELGNVYTNTGSFSRATNMKSITTPSGVSYGAACFSGCTNIDTIVLNPSHVFTENGFNSCGVKLLVTGKYLSYYLIYDTSTEYSLYQCYGLRDCYFSKQSGSVPDLGTTCIRKMHIGSRCGTINNLPPTLENDIEIPEGVTYLRGRIQLPKQKKLKLPSTLTKTKGGSIFMNCYSLEEIDLPDGFVVEDDAQAKSMFSGCRSLEKVRIGAGVKKIGTDMFRYCRRLREIIFGENLEGSTGSYCFSDCSSLREVDMSMTKITSFGTYCFQNVPKLDIIKFPKTFTNISTYNYLKSKVWDFSLCEELPTFYNNTSVTIASTDVFYVWNGIYDQWLISPWADYTSNFIGIGIGVIVTEELPSLSIFNTEYTVSLDFKGFEHEPSDIIINTSLFTYSVNNLTKDGCDIIFNPTNTLGKDTITIQVVYDDEVIEKTFTTTVYETMPTNEYFVEDAGETYSFTLNDDGYYYNTNQKVDNSYCMSKITVTTVMDKITISYQQTSENNYDYAIISKPNQTLVSSNTIDTSTTLVHTTTKGVTTSTDKTITYETGGLTNFYFYIKYRKDSSTSTGIDTFKFKIDFE